jgi:hypothetical protein
LSEREEDRTRSKEKIFIIYFVQKERYIVRYTCTDWVLSWSYKCLGNVFGQNGAFRIDRLESLLTEVRSDVILLYRSMLNLADRVMKPTARFDTV